MMIYIIYLNFLISWLYYIISVDFELFMLLSMLVINSKIILSFQSIVKIVSFNIITKLRFMYFCILDSEKL